MGFMALKSLGFNCVTACPRFAGLRASGVWVSGTGSIEFQPCGLRVFSAWLGLSRLCGAPPSLAFITVTVPEEAIVGILRFDYFPLSIPYCVGPGTLTWLGALQVNPGQAKSWQAKATPPYTSSSPIRA